MKIFIFGLVIAFFIFKIGYWSNAYAGVVTNSGNTIYSEDISFEECLEVLMNGNFYPKENNEFGSSQFVFYKGYKYYIIEVFHKNGGAYICEMKIKLVPQ